MIPEPSTYDLDRFWDQIEVDGDCWVWLGYTTDAGYGRFYTRRVQVYTHRFSWTIHNGPIPDGRHVLHKCDNPPCVKPDHLFLGTNEDNIADKIAKGRQPKGFDQSGAVVPDWLIDEASSLYQGRRGLWTQRDIAEYIQRLGYPVNQSTVSRWIHGRTRVERTTLGD